MIWNWLFPEFRNRCGGGSRLALIRCSFSLTVVPTAWAGCSSSTGTAMTAVRPTTVSTCAASAPPTPAAPLLRRPRETGTGSLLSARLAKRRRSLSEVSRCADTVRADPLRKIRVLLRRILLNDASGRLNGPTEQYGKAAERLTKAGEGVQ